MQNVNALYRSIVSGYHWFEAKLVIAGTITVGQDELIGITIEHDIYGGNGASVGNVAAADIDIEMLVPSAAIPRRATLEPYVRACNPTQQSDWIPQGLFYLDTRERVHTHGGIDIIKIHGYDSILKSELVFETEDTLDPANYPMPMDTAVARICSRYGFTQDPNNAISHKLAIENPGFGDDALTGREVLSGIAAANGGNWMMTANGLLRFVPLCEPYAEDAYLIADNGDFIITDGGDNIIV